MSGYRLPREFGAVCQRQTLARSCELCDHFEEIAGLTARLAAAEARAERAEAAWGRLAALVRAYEQFRGPISSLEGPR